MNAQDRFLAAAKNGDAAEVRRCLAEGVAADHSGNYALVLAVTGGYLDVVQALVEAGAPLNDLDEDRDGTFISYVTLAYDGKHWDVAEYLVNAGADARLRIGVVSNAIITDVPLEKLKVFARASLAAESLQAQGLQEDSVAMLSMAMLAKREDVLDWALGEGHLNEMTKREIFRRAVHRRPEYLFLLKKHGLFYHDDAEHGTPLIRAIARDNMEALKNLIALGADVNQMSPAPPLLRAIEEGKATMAQALLEAGADIFARGREALSMLSFHDMGMRDVVEGHAVRQQAEWLKKFNAGFEGRPVREILAADNLPFGQSGLLMALKAGIFPEFLERMRAENAFFDDADPLLLVQQDDHATSALRLLEVSGHLDLVADHRLWRHPDKNLNALLPFFPDDKVRARFQSRIDETLARRDADENVDFLRRKVGDKSRFKL